MISSPGLIRSAYQNPLIAFATQRTLRRRRIDGRLLGVRLSFAFVWASSAAVVAPFVDATAASKISFAFQDCDNDARNRLVCQQPGRHPLTVTVTHLL